MEKSLNDYLARVEKYLKPMAVSERVDIVKEIKSEMQELQNEGKPPQEILERLGDARELARAYLGESIAKGRGFSWRRFTAVIAFYSMAGAVGVCVLPVTSICAVAFLLSGALCPLAGVVKFVGALLGFEMPYIGIQLGSDSAGPGLVLVLSVVIGAVIMAAGWLLWKLTVWMIRSMAQGHKKLAR